MKKLMSAIALAAALTLTLLAAEDLSGKWSGSFNITMDGETKNEAIYLNLTHKGTEITGTAGPSAEEQWPILNGKIEGAKVTFDVQADRPLVKFDLTLTDGHLKGNAKAEVEGKSFSAVVDAQRAAK
jgi:phage gp45-like